MFEKTKFLISAAKQEQFPATDNPEIAIVGRSNVGKSSLLNHLTQNKNLAFVSSKPGKTQLINFFDVDDHLMLVDLPGYGFANVSKSIKESWSNLIQGYLQNRKNLSLILLLIDLRHPPSSEDLLFANWATHFKRPLLIVFTKADKLKRSEVDQRTRENLTLLTEAIGVTSFPHVIYSIKEAKWRKNLTHAIKEKVQWD